MRSGLGLAPSCAATIKSTIRMPAKTLTCSTTVSLESCQIYSDLRTSVLKNELSFEGFVMSDWGAQHSGAGAALAGLDMSMPGDTAFDSGQSFWGSNLTLAVLNGSVPEWRIDDMGE
jgi:beta-glucosidase-like glycosyl hydrolase